MINYSDVHSYIKKSIDSKNNQNLFTDTKKNKLKKLNSAKINFANNINNKEDGIKSKFNYIKKIEVKQNKNQNLNKSISQNKEEIFSEY